MNPSKDKMYKIELNHELGRLQDIAKTEDGKRKLKKLFKKRKELDGLTLDYLLSERGAEEARVHLKTTIRIDALKKMTGAEKDEASREALLLNMRKLIYKSKEKKQPTVAAPTHTPEKMDLGKIAKYEQAMSQSFTFSKDKFDPKKIQTYTQNLMSGQQAFVGLIQTFGTDMKEYFVNYKKVAKPDGHFFAIKNFTSRNYLYTKARKAGSWLKRNTIGLVLGGPAKSTYGTPIEKQAVKLNKKLNTLREKYPKSRIRKFRNNIVKRGKELKEGMKIAGEIFRKRLQEGLKKKIELSGGIDKSISRKDRIAQWLEARRGKRSMLLAGIDKSKQMEEDIRQAKAGKVGIRQKLLEKGKRILKSENEFKKWLKKIGSRKNQLSAVMASTQIAPSSNPSQRKKDLLAKKKLKQFHGKLDKNVYQKLDKKKKLAKEIFGKNKKAVKKKEAEEFYLDVLLGETYHNASKLTDEMFNNDIEIETLQAAGKFEQEKHDTLSNSRSSLNDILVELEDKHASFEISRETMGESLDKLENDQFSDGKIGKIFEQNDDLLHGKLRNVSGSLGFAEAWKNTPILGWIPKGLGWIDDKLGLTKTLSKWHKGMRESAIKDKTWGFWKGLAASGIGLLNGAAHIVFRPGQVLEGIGTILTDLNAAHQTLKALVHWDTWGKNEYAAGGMLAGDVLVMVLTGGSSAGVQAGVKGGMVAARIGKWVAKIKSPVGQWAAKNLLLKPSTLLSASAWKATFKAGVGAFGAGMRRIPQVISGLGRRLRHPLKGGFTREGRQAYLANYLDDAARSSADDISSLKNTLDDLETAGIPKGDVKKLERLSKQNITGTDGVLGIPTHQLSGVIDDINKLIVKLSRKPGFNTGLQYRLQMMRSNFSRVNKGLQKQQAWAAIDAADGAMPAVKNASASRKMDQILTGSDAHSTAILADYQAATKGLTTSGKKIRDRVDGSLGYLKTRIDDLDKIAKKTSKQNTTLSSLKNLQDDLNAIKEQLGGKGPATKELVEQIQKVVTNPKVAKGKLSGLKNQCDDWVSSFDVKTNLDVLKDAVMIDTMVRSGTFIPGISPFGLGVRRFQTGSMLKQYRRYLKEAEGKLPSPIYNKHIKGTLTLVEKRLKTSAMWKDLGLHLWKTTFAEHGKLAPFMGSVDVVRGGLSIITQKIERMFPREDIQKLYKVLAEWKKRYKGKEMAFINMVVGDLNKALSDDQFRIAFQKIVSSSLSPDKKLKKVDDEMLKYKQRTK